jgi:hypothetical protein
MRYKLSRKVDECKPLVDGHRAALRRAAAMVGLAAGAARDLAAVLNAAASFPVGDGSKKLRATPPPPPTAVAPDTGRTADSSAGAYNRPLFS